MKKISSGTTFFTKKLFPLIWFGFLAFMVVESISGGWFEEDPMVVAGPLIMAAFGFVLFKYRLWNLADAVYDRGDHLLIRSGSREDKLFLDNIVGVSVSSFSNPTRITLHLSGTEKFEDQVAFIPITRFSWNPFQTNPIAKDLMLRVDQAKTQRADRHST